MRPFFLITNDDGIQAEGIRHLWEAVSDFADVAIVAPHSEKSGSGLGITWKKPLLVRKINWERETGAWSVTGTPADCVKMALSTVLTRMPDLILSGVNRGSNSGKTVLYSGTIGGVIEGIFRNIPGIAFSYCDTVMPSLSVTKPYLSSLIRHFWEEPLAPGVFANINFPLSCETQIKGIRMASQGKGYWVESPEQRLHPEGMPYYWLGGKWRSFHEDPDSDVALLQKGYITVVPMRVVDLTDYDLVESRKAQLELNFPSHSVPLSEHSEERPIS